jgi:hypothetical protein
MLMSPLALLVAILLASGEARAGDKATAEEAETLIQRGLRLRKAGDDAGALPEFQKAHQLAPTPRTAAQLGLVEQALGHWDEAEGHLAVAIRSTSDPWVEKHRDSLQSAMVVVRGHIGSVQITGEPSGAEVYINGRLVGRLPLNQPITVIAGEVDIELRADGYRKKAEKIAVGNNQHKPFVMRLEKVDSPAPRVVEDARRLDVTSGGEPTASREREATVIPPKSAATDGHAIGPIVGWSLAGVGLATVTVGVVDALLGQSKMDAAVVDANAANAMMNMELYKNAQSKLSSGRSQRSAGVVVSVVGGVVAVGGVIVALVTRRPPAAETAMGTIEPWLGASGSQVAVGGLKWSRTW